MEKNCVVVYPIYKAPSSIELNFLENGIKVNADFEQVIVAPESLIINHSFGILQKIRIKRFNDRYFEGIEGYNCLMLSKDFYSSFIEFEFMLIHQPDVYLFKNELAYWCKKDYAYIGAPWFKPEKIGRGKIYGFLHQKIWQTYLTKKRKNGWLYNKVGNGGLSLRNIQKAIETLNKAPLALINAYIATVSPHYNEDIFWSIEAPKIIDFKIPKWDEALRFAIEFDPRKAYSFLNQNLPFGCHAPLKHEPEFWKKFIPILN
ncbi:DUF5672 family protein [Pedobacter sp. Du54]|uniref:DUF5672 family protein n=1 Tax=Pedobacter anseongensis TaxID=3133439 RepID=UPI003097EAA2